MPKRTNEYQELVFRLESALAPTGARVVQSALLRDRSGVEREVDVLIEGEIGGHRLGIAVECRTDRRPQDLTWVDELLGKYAELDVQRVVAVSRSGFTRSALARIEASRGRMTALTFNDALAHDWRQEFEGLFVGLTVLTIQALRAELQYPESPPGLTVGDLDCAELETGVGKPCGSLKRFVEHHGKARASELTTDLVRSQPSLFPTEFSFGIQLFDDDLFIRSATDARARVQINLLVTVRVEMHEVALQRHVYGDTPITMGSIELEKQRFEISLVHTKVTQPKPS